MIEFIAPLAAAAGCITGMGYAWVANRRFKADIDSIGDFRIDTQAERAFAQQRLAEQRLAECSATEPPSGPGYGQRIETGAVPLVRQYDVRRAAMKARAERQRARPTPPSAAPAPVQRPKFPKELPASLRPDVNPFSPTTPTSWRDRFTEWWVSHADPK